MTNHPKAGGQTQALPGSAEAWVHDVLEPDQFSRAKVRFGPRILSRPTIILLWGLRIYVFLMGLLIALQVWNALHLAK